MRHRVAFAALVVLALSLSAMAEAGPKKTIPRGVSIFIAPMPEGLDGFIKAELLNQGCPSEDRPQA